MAVDLRSCPKNMTFGPCGGVMSSGTCEIGDRPCPFVPAAPWISPAPTAAAVPIARIVDPLLLVDVRAPKQWAGDARALWEETAAVLDGCGALLGEHVDNPAHDDDSGRLPPETVIAVLAERGVATFATVTGRDRSAEEALASIERYRAAGAVAIHCVTGDHPLALGLERSTSFRLESITLAAAASAAGHPISIGESPASPGDRVRRVLAKERAGASLCILNHGGSPADLIAFVDACRASGATVEFVAPVPMIADVRSALALDRFPGSRLPAGYVDSIVQAADPYEQALDNAAQLTAELAASERFIGVNLSGSARDTTPGERLRSTAEFIEVAHRNWISSSGSARA